MTLQTLAAYATLVALAIMIIQIIIGAVRRVKWREYLRLFRIWASCLLVVVLLGVDIFMRMALPPPVQDTSTYGFETMPVKWMPRTSHDVKGLTDVAQSNEQAKLGEYSLKIDVDLVGGSDHAKGEAYVGFSNRNLVGKQISVNVFFSDASVCGPNDAPSGFQIFAKSKVGVKDAYKTGHYYGDWNDITSDMVGEWTEFSMTPSTVPAADGVMSADFDPASVVEIGVLLGLNDKATSEKYEGSIFIDAVRLSN